MKGVANIIEIILILMIVVAIVALAYSWFSGIFGDIMRIVAAALTRSTTIMSTRFRLESAMYDTTSGKVTAVIRNTGSQSFNISTERLAAYIEEMNSPVYSVDIGSPYTLTGGSLAKVSVTNNTESCNRNLKITIETGLGDSKIIGC